MSIQRALSAAVLVAALSPAVTQAAIYDRLLAQDSTLTLTVREMNVSVTLASKPMFATHTGATR